MNDRLISADALLKRICELCGENCEMPNEAVTCIEWEFAHDAIESLPPVDTVPKAYYDNLLKRFKHLIQSDYIRSFDAWDSRKNDYVLDIRDAEPVRHGHWDVVKSSIHPYGNDVACSVCGFKMGSSFGYGFCPNCGAKMDGGKEDATETGG